MSDTQKILFIAKLAFLTDDEDSLRFYLFHPQYKNSRKRSGGLSGDRQIMASLHGSDSTKTFPIGHTVLLC